MPLREFSEFEKNIVREKLVKTGGKLSSLFDDNFNREVRIIIHYFESKNRKFEFRSEKYSGEQIYNVLVDVIELLSFLLENKYLYRHFLPATNLNDFNVEKQISIGDFDGAKSLNFMASDDQNFISDFIIRNENTIFKATEPLRALAKRNFLSQEEIHHNEILEQSSKSTNTALAVGLGTILVGIGTIVSTCVNSENSAPILFEKIGVLEERLNHLSAVDSLRSTCQEWECSELRDQLDSIKR